MAAHLAAPMWLGTAILAAVPIYVVLQILFACIWRGGWRLAALVPLIIVLPAVVLTAYGGLHGSNLAPLPLIVVAPVALGYLLIAAVAHGIKRLSAG